MYYNICTTTFKVALTGVSMIYEHTSAKTVTE